MQTLTRMVTVACFVSRALCGIQSPRAAVTPAAIRLTATAGFQAGALEERTYINSNRQYTFLHIPKELLGQSYTVQQHRHTTALEIEVVSKGLIRLALWDTATPEKLKLGPGWRVMGTMAVGGADCAGWNVFERMFEAGERMTVPSPDRWGAVLIAKSIIGPPRFSAPEPPPSGHSQNAQFQALEQQIKRHGTRSPELKAKLGREALRRESLIADTDRTPVDVVLRRSKALAEYLLRMYPSLNLTDEIEQLNALQNRVRDTAATDLPRLFEEACALRRQIAFRNPLLCKISLIAFLEHGKQAHGSRHMIDQYTGFNARIGGSVYVLENPFSDTPIVKDLLADSAVTNGRLKGTKISGVGSFISLEVDYDAKRILFAWTEGHHKLPENPSYDDQYVTEKEAKRLGSNRYYHYRHDNTYHIFAVNADGSDLTQLTDGRWNEFDPCFLPNGRIVFVSERGEGGIRCGSRPLVSTTLHAMMPDGSDIIPLSRHDTNEWHPSIDDDGMIVYTRWDYVDRDSDIAHHIWRCYPDGRNPRSLHGNYPEKRECRPWMEMSIRSIPGSHRFVATATPHHGEAYGSLVVIDERVDDDQEMAQLRRLTPEYHLPEAEAAPGVPHPDKKGRHSPKGEVFGTPWPLSEDFYLCVLDEGQQYYGIYLLDSFGNTVPIYTPPQKALLDSIPLHPRLRPPIIPTGSAQAKADRETQPDPKPQTARLLVINAYEADQPWPEGTRLKELRIISVFPKSNAFLDEPRVGVAPQSLARGVLGTVPIEEDGSACCEIPVDVGIYFQVLDEKGVAVQTMRSDTYAHAGELLTCVGCHEHKNRSSAQNRLPVPLALRHAPSKIQREAKGTYPLTFPRLVQPVLDRHCVICHQKSPKAPDLTGTEFAKYGWSRGALALQKLAWGKSGGNGSGLRYNGTSYSVPGRVGAMASKLYPMLLGGHHGLQLPDKDMRRITLWLDANSCFYGAYRGAKEQATGKVVAPKCAYLPEWEY